LLPKAADYPAPALRPTASTPKLSRQLLFRSQHFSTRQHLTTVFFGKNPELRAEPPGYLSNVRCRQRLSVLQVAPAIHRFPLNRYDVPFAFATLASIASHSFSPLSKYKKNNANDIEEELAFHRCPFRERARDMCNFYKHIV
jgi:hypothetical protein